jgi:hypothetical protein
LKNTEVLSAPTVLVVSPTEELKTSCWNVFFAFLLFALSWVEICLHHYPDYFAAIHR